MSDKKPGEAETVIDIKESSPEQDKNKKELQSRQKEKMQRNDKKGKKGRKFDKSDDLAFKAPGAINKSSTLIDDNELLGSFERDETGTILIIQDKNGNLLDKRGRKVNKHGYLVDRKGNILNKKGELVYNADEIDFGEVSEEVKQESESKENNKSELLLIDQRNIKEIAKTKEDELCSRRSDPIDPMMEDKPSNYDEMNMRKDAENFYKNQNALDQNQADYENLDQKILNQEASLNVTSISENKLKNDIRESIKDQKNEEKEFEVIHEIKKKDIVNKIEEDDILLELNIPQKKALLNEELKNEFGSINQNYNQAIEDYHNFAEDDPLHYPKLSSQFSKTGFDADTEKIKELEKVYLQRLEASNKKNKRKIPTKYSNLDFLIEVIHNPVKRKKMNLRR